MGAAHRKALEPSPGMARPPAEQPGAESLGPVLVSPARKKAGMRQALAESRREVAAQLPAIVRELAREALAGSVNHLKLFLELSGVLKGGLAAPERQVRQRTLEEILTEQWEQDKALEVAEARERDRARAEEVLSGL